MSISANPTVQQQAVNYDYLTVKQFCDKYKAFKVGGVRDRIFHSEKNGLKQSDAIVRNGKKVLINVPKWFAWIESPNGGV